MCFGKMHVSQSSSNNEFLKGMKFYSFQFIMMAEKYLSSNARRVSLQEKTSHASRVYALEKNFLLPRESYLRAREKLPATCAIFAERFNTITLEEYENCTM